MDDIDLGAENDARMARLREALALGGGFQLVIVQVEPGAQREEVLRRLAGWSGQPGMPALELVRLAPGESAVMRLAGERPGAVLVGLEADGADPIVATRAMVTELNWSRDRLPDLVHGPLVLVVSQRVQAALFEQAPDFYSWRAHSTSITPVATRPGLLWPRLAPVAEDPAVLEAMIADVEALQPPAVQELARLRARLGAAKALQGDLGQADAAFDQAYLGYARAGTIDDRVELWLLREVLAEARGALAPAAHWLARARQDAAQEPPSERLELRLDMVDIRLSIARGELDAAEVSIGRAMARAQRIEDDDVQAELETSLSFVLATRALAAGEPERAVVLLQEVLRGSRARGASFQEAAVLTVLASVTASLGRSDDAERFATEAVRRALASGSGDAIAGARASLAQIAMDNGHLEVARQALAGKVREAGVYAAGEDAAARARLALEVGDDAGAERQLRAAIEALRLAGAPVLAAKVALELASLGRRTRNWMLALTAYDTAERLDPTGQRAQAALGRAEIAYGQGEWTAALAEQLAVAAELLASTGDATHADIARTHRGEVLVRLGREAEAREELGLALAGFDARGQAEPADRVRRVLALLDRHEPPT
jgi:tetratricopeptide (TPR) repeat protein